LQGKHGAIVILNPQTGEVLALYSEPSYSFKDAQRSEIWQALDNDKKDKPLLDRSLNEYYVPGSTFKTLMMITAFRNGMQDIRLNTTGGFSPDGCNKTITDDNGSCEACGDTGIDVAYQKSSNIYFSLLAAEHLENPLNLILASKKLGFGEKSGIELPGEISGLRRRPYHAGSGATPCANRLNRSTHQ